MVNDNPDPLLSTSDVGKLLNLTPDGVRRLARLGQLAPDEQTPSGYKLYRESTIRAFAAEREKKRKQSDAERGRGRPPRAPSRKLRMKEKK